MRLRFDVARAFAAAGGLLIASCCVAAQSLIVSPFSIRFTATADSFDLPGPELIGLGVNGADKLEFKLAGVTPFPQGEPNFVIVSPASGVAPMTVRVALNPNVVPYLSSGSHILTLEFAAVGQPSSSGKISILLDLKGVPAPGVSAVLNAASLQPAISPGQIVSIFGTHLSTPPVTAQFDGTGVYPVDLSRTNYDGTDIRDGVTFNGVRAPLLYVSTTQINAQVPYEMTGQKSVNVVVTHNLAASPAFPVPLLDTSPGLFTVTQNGNGQGAILNAGPGFNTSSVNSADNPAAKGSAISIFATGSGLWNRTVQDGTILLDTITQPSAPVSLSIGGQPARILYAGAAPLLLSGVLQVNAIVPDGIGSGPQPVVLKVGQNSNTPQQVTVAIQ